jgi:hypothetical protein
MEQKKPEDSWKSWVSIITFSALGIWVIWLTNSSTWQREGEINMFPENAFSKNYRLPAIISAKTSRSFPFKETTQYQINSFTWPNAEEETEFDSDCKVTDKQSTKCVYKGKTYVVEIETPPEQPEGRSEDDRGLEY